LCSLPRVRGMSWEAKLFSDLGLGSVSLCSVLPSSCRLRSLACSRAIDSSDIFTWSASAARALTTAFIVLLSLPKSSSLCANRLGFLPILFNLGNNDVNTVSIPCTPCSMQNKFEKHQRPKIKSFTAKIHNASSNCVLVCFIEFY
jgi:hypothetical protein